MVVLRIDSMMVSSLSNDPISLANTATSANSSLSSSCVDDENDIEGGGYASPQEGNIENSADMHINITSSKFIPMRAGKMARRRSQCEQLSFRPQTQRASSELVTSSSMLLDGCEKRRSSLATPTNLLIPSSSSQYQLPKTIQFYPSAIDHHHHHYSNSKKQSSSRSPTLLVPTIILLIALFTITLFQQHTLTTLRSELQITNQHRTYMIQSQSNLLRQLQERESSMEQLKHSHDVMNKINLDMSGSVERLKEEIKELKKEREVEERLRSSSSR